MFKFIHLRALNSSNPFLAKYMSYIKTCLILLDQISNAAVCKTIMPCVCNENLEALKLKPIFLINKLSDQTSSNLRLVSQTYQGNK